tara:strand:+ start:1790 stop:2944 length:1155 start_codon:yes stop_codon:yes gene_type:complete
MIELSQPNLSKIEKKLILKVLNSKKLVDGIFQDMVEKKIKNIIKSNYVAVTQSCSSALEIAAILLKLKPKDEVLVPSFTFTSTANAFVMRGAKPVFVDVDEHNLNINLEDLEKKINKRTKAIFVVHYGGFCANIEKLIKIKKKYNLPLVEDAAHAFMTKYKNKYLGTFGDISAFSFHTTKNLVGAQCGALVINNKKFIKEADIILDKGTDRKRLINYKNKKNTTSFSNKNYYSWKNIGSEYRATELSSALLYGQLLRIKYLQTKREKLWNFYYKELTKINSKKFRIYHVSDKKIRQCYHLFMLIFKENKDAYGFRNHLIKNSIYASFHYIPLHLSSFSNQIIKKTKLPITEKIYKKIVRIPLHPSIQIKDAKFMINKIKTFLEN